MCLHASFGLARPPPAPSGDRVALRSHSSRLGTSARWRRWRRSTPLRRMANLNIALLQRGRSWVSTPAWASRRASREGRCSSSLIVTSSAAGAELHVRINQGDRSARFPLTIRDAADRPMFRESEEFDIALTLLNAPVLQAAGVELGWITEDHLLDLAGLEAEGVAGGERGPGPHPGSRWGTARPDRCLPGQRGAAAAKLSRPRATARSFLRRSRRGGNVALDTHGFSQVLEVIAHLAVATTLRLLHEVGDPGG